MGMRGHLRIDEAAHLRAHGFERVVETGVAEGAEAGPVGDVAGELGAVRGRVAVRDRGADGGRARGFDGALLKEQVGEAQRLALVHRDAAEHLRQVFARADADQELLDAAVATVGGETARMRLHLAQRFDLRREPGETVDRALLGFEEARVEAARHAHPGPHRGGRARHQALDRLNGGGEIVERIGRLQFRRGGHGGLRKWARILRRGKMRLQLRHIRARTAFKPYFSITVNAAEADPAGSRGTRRRR